MEENPKTRQILEMLAGGGSCDYQPVQGGVLVFNSDKKAYEGVDIETFLELREQGLISKQRTSHNWHPFFRPSFQNPIDIYGITKKGREYLKKQK